MLEQLRQRYRFVVVGYVIMPEHFHLLVSEPEIGDPSLIMKVLKQETAYQLNRESGMHESRSARSSHVWQKRFYDFNVWSERKRIEKLRYIHRNPVRRGLVSEPGQWRWSSFRTYACGEIGLVRVNFQEWKVEIKAGVRATFGSSTDPTHSQKAANEWATLDSTHSRRARE
jgi:putative transposase